VIDVSGKFETLREAHARATVRAKPETVDIVKAGKVPKGDVATSARVAGTLAAKKTSELIPLCHQVPLDWIKIDVTPGQDEIVIDAVVRTIWKTGVEVDALVAASVAALTVYDMLKPIDDGMTISDIRLIKKQGGVSQYTEAISPRLRTVVLVISDSTHAGRRVDKSGKTIVERLASQPVEVVEFKVLPDDVDLIRQELIRCCDELRADLVITTGGTGLGPKDLTVAATKGILDKEAPGIAEAVRAYGQKRTPYSMLSQGIAGVRKNTIIVALPGSSRGAAESIDALFPGIVHAFRMVRGGGHD
jgi:molybdenum cofactor biosynthesis protein MoaC